MPSAAASSVYHGVGSLFYGRRYIIVHNSGAAVTVTDGLGNFEQSLSDVANEYKSIEVMSTGTSWVIINSSLNPV